MIDEKKLIERVYTDSNYQRCPCFECWEHSSKDCDKCAIKEISVADVITIAENLAKEYNNGWIPCSERLPEENDYPEQRYRILASCSDGIVRNTTIKLLLDGEVGRSSSGNLFTYIAWMPLPEPYKEG